MTSLPDWPRAWGNPLAGAVIRQENADFLVEEIPIAQPDGEGEHVWLWVEKSGQNTAWVAEQIARSARIPARAVSFAGQKDRHAITRQFFSAHLPGREWNPDECPLFAGDFGVKLCHWSRHSRKLKRGGLKGNRFVIHLRMDAANQSALDERLKMLAAGGVPNYFGEQRFGRQGANLSLALELFRGRRLHRNKRAMMLSAARSWLFNQVLARRVEDSSWCRLLPDEIAIIDGRKQRFAITVDDSDAHARCERGEIHPSGVLYGDSNDREGGFTVLENEVLAQFPDWTSGLNTMRLQADRRALRLIPRHLDWNWGEAGLTLRFELPPGAYATAVLRELVSYRNFKDIETESVSHRSDNQDRQ